MQRVKLPDDTTWMTPYIKPLLPQIHSSDETPRGGGGYVPPVDSKRIVNVRLTQITDRKILIPLNKELQKPTMEFDTYQQINEGKKFQHVGYFIDMLGRKHDISKIRILRQGVDGTYKVVSATEKIDPRYIKKKYYYALLETTAI
jgi:hypothetical protein